MGFLTGLLKDEHDQDCFCGLLLLLLLLKPRLMPRLMLVSFMEPMAMVPVLGMLDLATTARGLLMLDQRLMLMPVYSMEPMAMVLVLDMLDLDMDILVLDMLDMVVMD